MSATDAPVLVLGGTGKVGRRVVALLRARGVPVRAASRRGETVFDWNDEITWPPALDGASAVFVVGPGSATDWSPRLRRLLELAHAADVERAVLLSARAVEFLPDGAVARAEAALRDGPLPWVVLRPTHFAQNFTEAMFQPVDGRIVAPVGDGREPFIDVDDLAEVAVEALTDPRWHGETLELSGPEALTFAETVDLLGRAGGEPLRFVDETLDEHLRALQAAGIPEGYLIWRAAMLSAIRRGDDAYTSTDVARVLGRPARSVAEWASSAVG